MMIDSERLRSLLPVLLTPSLFLPEPLALLPTQFPMLLVQFKYNTINEICDNKTKTSSTRTNNYQTDDLLTNQLWLRETRLIW